MNGYAIFKTTGSAKGFPELWNRSGQTVAICRELEDESEIDKTEVGPMYLVEFPDGYCDSVFEDELTPTPRDGATKGATNEGQIDRHLEQTDV